MNLEIERKFLYATGRWRPPTTGGKKVRQGYLSLDPERSVRIRVAEDVATLTIKGPREGLTRPEFEYPIPLAHGMALLALCIRPLILKTRYTEVWAGHAWTIDVFGGVNTGLVLAEVELESEDAPLDLPPWVDEEVTHDPRYTNTNLVTAPFTQWGAS